MAGSNKDTQVPVATPLGPDKFHLVELTGTESIGALFSFCLRLSVPNVSENTPPEVDFSKLLGQEMTFSLHVNTGDDEAKQAKRHFSGICVSFAQDGTSDTHTEFIAEIAPKLWLLQLQTRSRIFQRSNVPDILKEVFSSLDVDYQLNRASYEPREY